MEFDKFIKSRDTNNFQYYKLLSINPINLSNNNDNLYIIIVPEYNTRDLDASNFDNKFVKYNYFWLYYDESNDYNNAYQLYTNGKICDNDSYTIIIRSYVKMIQLKSFIDNNNETIEITTNNRSYKFTKCDKLNYNKIIFNCMYIKPRVILCVELNNYINLPFSNKNNYLITVINQPETYHIPHINTYLINTTDSKFIILDHLDYTISSNKTETVFKIDTNIGNICYCNKHIVNNCKSTNCSINDIDVDVIDYKSNPLLVQFIKDKKIINSIGVNISIPF